MDGSWIKKAKFRQSIRAGAGCVIGRSSGRLFTTTIVLGVVLFVGVACLASVKCEVTPLTAENPVGTSHTISITVTSDGFKLAGTKFVVCVTEGPNAGLERTVVADSNGRATFTYTSNGKPGTDTITITGTDPDTGHRINCTTASKTWIGQEPEAVPPEEEVPPPEEALDEERVQEGLRKANTLLEYVLSSYAEQEIPESQIVQILEHVFDHVVNGAAVGFPKIGGEWFSDICHTFFLAWDELGDVMDQLDLFGYRIENGGQLPDEMERQGVLDGLAQLRQFHDELTSQVGKISSDDLDSGEVNEKLREARDLLADVTGRYSSGELTEGELRTQLEGYFTTVFTDAMNPFPDVAGYDFAELCFKFFLFEGELGDLKDDLGLAAHAQETSGQETGELDRELLLGRLQSLKEKEEELEQFIEEPEPVPSEEEWNPWDAGMVFYTPALAV